MTITTSGNTIMNHQHIFYAALVSASVFLGGLLAAADARAQAKFNALPHNPQINQLLRYQAATGQVPVQANNFFLRQQALLQQYQPNRFLFNSYLYRSHPLNQFNALSYGNPYSAFNNPYWYNSPIVSRYGYYGNPWGPMPFHPYYGYGYQFGAFGPYGPINPLDPYGQFVNNPFAQQGPFGIYNRNLNALDPADLLK